MSDQTEGFPTSTLNESRKQKPIVKKPKKYLKPRKGRGFSLKEIKAAAIPLDDAKKLPITIDPRRKSLHNENVQILSALYRKTISLRSEEKIKLELSEKEAFKELKQLKGIKGKEAKLLIEAGIKSLTSLIEEEPNSLADDTNIKVEKIEKWIEQAKNLLKRKSFIDTMNELLQVKGMNKTYARKLVNFGVLSLEDLSQEDATILSKDLKISEKIVSVWIEDAMRLTGKPIKKKPAKKPKIEKKAPTLPTLADIEGIKKEDLKELKNLGITTLQELAQENATEIASITGIQEEIIQRWIQEARNLLGLPPVTQPPKEPSELPTEVEKEEVKDPLSELLQLRGVGRKTAEKLVEAGIKSCIELTTCDPKELSKKAKISEKALNKIIEAAKELME